MTDDREESRAVNHQIPIHHFRRRLETSVARTTAESLYNVNPGRMWMLRTLTFLQWTANTAMTTLIQNRRLSTRTLLAAFVASSGLQTILDENLVAARDQ